LTAHADVDYGSPRYVKPFLVRSIWNDGQFTYIKADATELSALYEVKDGKPALLNFQVHEGTYVVLDKGYLALGKERFDFLQQGLMYDAFQCRRRSIPSPTAADKRSACQARTSCGRSPRRLRRRRCGYKGQPR
jgi:hypothetical protein